MCVDPGKLPPTVRRGHVIRTVSRGDEIHAHLFSGAVRSTEQSKLEASPASQGEGEIAGEPSKEDEIQDLS